MKNRKITAAQITFAVISMAIMVLIFLFSCENADESSETSGIIKQLVINLLYKDFDSYTIERQTELSGMISHIVRKAAHFNIYLALGFSSSMAIGKRKMLGIGSLVSLLVCFAYACSDELHQYFVPGRACMLRDVLLDTCGAMVGICISFAVVGILTRLTRRKL